MSKNTYEKEAKNYSTNYIQTYLDLYYLNIGLLGKFLIKIGFLSDPLIITAFKEELSKRKSKDISEKVK